MVTGLSFVACVLCMVSSFLIAQGKLRAVYVLGLINCFCLIGLNATLAATDPGILFMVIPSLWGIAMNLLGLKRLRNLQTLTE